MLEHPVDDWPQERAIGKTHVNNTVLANYWYQLWFGKELGRKTYHGIIVLKPSNVIIHGQPNPRKVTRLELCFPTIFVFQTVFFAGCLALGYNMSVSILLYSSNPKKLTSRKHPNDSAKTRRAIRGGRRAHQSTTTSPRAGAAIPSITYAVLGRSDDMRNPVSMKPLSSFGTRPGGARRDKCSGLKEA